MIVNGVNAAWEAGLTVAKLLEKRTIPQKRSGKKTG